MENYEKKYKELEGKIKKAYLYAQTDSTKAVLEDIMPELAMSEDEKIRKEIVRFIQMEVEDEIVGNKWLAWLKKQESVEEIVERCKKSWYNEGKIAGMAEGLSDDEKYQQGWHDALEAIKEKADNANKVEPKFHEGEWIILTAGELSTTLQIVSVDTNKKLYWFNDSSYLPIVDEDCLHIWTIADAKDADVLYSLDSKQPFIFKHRKPNEQAKVYCGINIYGKFFVGNTKDCIITTDKYIPATKDQRDTLLKAMADAGYEWDAEKKELKKIEQEPENYKRQVMSEMTDLVIDYIKQKPTKWRPSNAQIKALEHFVRGIGESGFVSPYDANLKLVHSLLNDLKKLKS